MMDGLDMILLALGFNLLDIVTGLIGAIKNKTLDSSKLRDGIFKKVGYMLIYFLAWLIDTEGDVLGFELGFNILPAVITYIIYTEVVSFCENISEINPDLLPEKILSLLKITTTESEVEEVINMMGETINESLDGKTVTTEGADEKGYVTVEETETGTDESYETDNNAEPDEDDVMMAEAETEEVKES